MAALIRITRSDLLQASPMIAPIGAGVKRSVGAHDQRADRGRSTIRSAAADLIPLPPD